MKMTALQGSAEAAKGSENIISIALMERENNE